MQKQKAFVIGDLHGCYDELQQLLEHWNRDEEILVFLGDYIDRGPKSLQVVQYVMELQKQSDDVIALKGNHEDMFLDWMSSEQVERFLRNGGVQTLDSMIEQSETFEEGSYAAFRTIIEEEFNEELQFLKQLPHFYEWGEYLFVHAGIDVDKELVDQTKEDYLWIREPFHDGHNRSDKTIVFGHTPVQRLHEDQRDEAWFSECKTKIGIDGGAVFGGPLIGLKLNFNGEPEVIAVNDDKDENTDSIK
ncbi:hypothetical protein DH09_17650 [Bacillaceae bacterium JMAK1]|nr:hypothetical protein DH09_17650 [Bacillaceae bacterium JMAK1]